jgi:hypothetical protein
MPAPGTGKRILWFVGLWFAGVICVATVGLLIKLWLGA